MLTSPFPSFIFEQNSHKEMVNHSENQNRGYFINFVVILTEDKLQVY